MKITKLFFSLYIILFFSSSFSFAQLITIDAARQLPLGSVVTIRGIVTSGPELGAIRYLQDPTAGIGLYANSIAIYNPGDSIEVTGTTVDFNGLLELNPIASNLLISGLNPLPSLQIFTPSQLDESNESELVQINGVVFANGGAPIAGGASYNFSFGSETSSMYVRSNSPLVGEVLPSGACNLIGIASQYQANYQLLVRYASDIISLGSINIITPLTTSNISTSGFSINWKTDELGSSFVKYGLTTSLGSISNVNSSQDTVHSFGLSNLLPGNIYYCKAYSVNALGDTAMSPIRAFGTKSLSTGNVKVYFNTAVNNNASTGILAQQLFQAIDDTLIAYINRAQRTLDLTIYDFDNAQISNISAAINAAKSRGVKVRFISDGDQAPTNFGVADLAANVPRIASPTGGQYNIMHNKFVIIDAFDPNPNNPIVWTGSTNWTDRQINRDPNNVVIIQDQTLAKTYTLEFEEMWGDTSDTPNLSNSKFGPFKTDNTPHEFVLGPNNKRLECYFSPSDGTNSYLLKSIRSANTEVDFATMINTRSDITTAISDLINYTFPPVTVKGLVNNQTTTTQWSTMSTIMGSSLLYNLDTNVIMHHKYCIIDQADVNSDPILWTGSHNWSTSANTINDENTVVFHDAEIANQFYQEFVSLYNQNGGNIIIIPASINDVVYQSIVNIFPNPATNNLINVKYIKNEISSNYENTLLISIYDISGKQVLSQQFHATNGENNYQMNLDGLSQGLYLLKVNIGNFSKTIKLVVNN
jgi:phosphatidylserine/phosphatidylglycerophosphate/cardiolipin synthase-like enzyme